jgi:hypothetical protein
MGIQCQTYWDSEDLVPPPYIIKSNRRMHTRRSELSKRLQSAQAENSRAKRVCEDPGKGDALSPSGIWYYPQDEEWMPDVVVLG